MSSTGVTSYLIRSVEPNDLVNPNYSVSYTGIGADIKSAELCKTILPEECNGDPNLCEDEDTINKLIKRLKAVRSMPKKNKE